MASTYLDLYVHIIFATKDRAPTIVEPWMKDLHAYLGGTIRGLGASPLAIGGIEDHVHILARLKATHAVADLVRETKKAATSWVVEEKYDRFGWQAGYAAFSVGHSRNTQSRFLHPQST